MKNSIVFFILLLTAFNIHAEDGHNLWLRAKSSPTHALTSGYLTNITTHIVKNTK